MKHVEEREFTLRLEVRREFSEGYEGEEDGYEWTWELRAITSELVGAAVELLRRHPGWTVRPGNRGRALEDEVTLVVERAS